MRKLKLLMLAFMATCGLSVNAADIVIGQKFTSIEDLEGQKFTIVNETDGKAVYNSDNQNLKYDTYATAVTGECYQFVLESLDNNADASVHGMYALKCVKTNGTSPNVFGQTPIYLNSGKPDGFNGCFVLGNGTQFGTDFKYGGVWEVEYVEGSGFSLKNKGIGGYFKGIGSRPDATEPVYWTFCTLIEDPLPAAKEKYDALKTKYLAINANLNVTEADAQKTSATTVDEVQTAIDKLISTFGTYLANVGAETDLTGLITNPSFETNGVSGWTNNGMQAQGNKVFGGTVGNNYCEAWQPNGTKGVSQTLTLPKGAYRLTANSLARGVTSAKLYIGTKETAITIADASNNYRADILSNNNGDVIIGFEGVGSGAGASWLCVDNFQLTYLGNMSSEDFEAFEAYQAALDAYNEAMAAATGLSGKVPTTAYLPVQQAINEYTVTDGTTDQYNTAAVALNAAVANAQPLAAPYATWLTLKANALTVATGHTKITAAINKVVLYVETLTAKDDLDNVNIMAAALIKNYRAWDELKKNADALEATSTTDVAGRTEVAEVRDAQAANISNAAVDTQEDIATLINVTIPTATATLKAKMTTYVKTAQPTNDECFDITFLIENAHFYEGEGGNKVATGWTLAEGGWITEHRLATHNFEAWHAHFDLSQTITDLPKGTYKVTLQGFARHDNGSVTDKTNLYCGIVDQKIKDIKEEWSTISYYSSEQPAMGDGNRDTKYQKDNVDVYQPNGMTGAYYWFQKINPQTNQPFYTNEVQTLITEPGDLKIGFKCEADADWVLWDNFHLYYYGSAIAVEINEESPKSYSEDVENANVTLKRTFKNNGAWNTFFVPFDLSDEETKAAFGDDVQVATFSETADGIHSTISFNAADDASIDANVPVLLKTSTTETEFTFNGKTIKAGEAKAAGTNFDFVGTYAASTTIAEGDYFIGSNKLFQSTGNTTIKGLRAYLKKTESADPEARITKFFIDGEETTAIDGLKMAGNSGKIYNLNGQEVKNAGKGIFIQNGKKIVVK